MGSAAALILSHAHDSWYLRQKSIVRAATIVRCSCYACTLRMLRDTADVSHRIYEPTTIVQPSSKTSEMSGSQHVLPVHKWPAAQADLYARVWIHRYGLSVLDLDLAKHTCEAPHAVGLVKEKITLNLGPRCASRSRTRLEIQPR